MVLTQEHAKSIPLTSACEALVIPRSTFYARRRAGAEERPARTARQGVHQPRALTGEERQRVREILNSDEFCNRRARSISVCSSAASICAR